MRILTKEEFFLHKEQWYSAIKKGAVFMYPTDTIYGIGCNAKLDNAVQKIRKAKERVSNPFSVIAPGKQWIREQCEVTTQAEEWLAKLPGTYTIIFRLRNKKSVSKSVTMGNDTLGVRIPKHWISAIVAELGIPIVTTSVNKAGKDFITKPSEMEESIRDQVNFAIDDGILSGKPSTLIHADKENIEIVERK